MKQIYSSEEEIISNRLEKYYPKIKDAYLGSIIALRSEEYNDRLVHFAHSLREVIDLLARFSQANKKINRKPGINRILNISKNIGFMNTGSEKLELEYENKLKNICKDIPHQYRKLSDVAHHGRNITQEDAELKMNEIQKILKKLFDV